MDPNIRPLERAFQLAKSGRCSTINELLNALIQDGYGIDQVRGPTIRKQLRTLMEEAKRSKKT